MKADSGVWVTSPTRENVAPIVRRQEEESRRYLSGDDLRATIVDANVNVDYPSCDEKDDR